MINIENEVPKYKKKSQKTVKKSKHKHTYKECLILDKKLNLHMIGEYCIICGKIGNVKLSESEKMENGYFRMLTQRELLEKHKDLELKEIESIFKNSHVAL